MAVPEIDPTQSVPGYLQWQTFIHQFAAFSDSAILEWAAPGIPPGTSFNDTTGRLTGAATTGGFYSVAVKARNVDGWSDAVIFSFAIWHTSNVPPSSLAEASWDIGTKTVKITGFGEKTPWLLKRGDTFMLYLRIVRGDLSCDLNLASLKLGLKLDEPSPLMVLSGAFLKQGSGIDTAYLLHIALTGTLLDAALSEYEGAGDAESADFDSRLAKILALAEFEAVETSPYSIGPATLRHSSATFPVRVDRDLIPTA